MPDESRTPIDPYPLSEAEALASAIAYQEREANRQLAEAVSRPPKAYPDLPPEYRAPTPSAQPRSERPTSSDPLDDILEVSWPAAILGGLGAVAAIVFIATLAHALAVYVAALTLPTL